MIFAKDDDMIRAFAPNAPIKPLDVGILPGAVVRRQHLFENTTINR
jgi:hypothetical protein